MPAAAPTAPPRRTALIAGATGLVGRALLPLLLDGRRYALVHALLRRAAPSLPTHARLALHVVDFTHLAGAVPAVDDAYIALGTTIKVAGSQAAFRAVDLDAVVATARAAREAGARRLAVVSALGADARSPVFYNRIKGEMQEAVAGLGYDSVVLAQPSLLLGDREALGQPTRPLEQFARLALAPLLPLVPRRVRPIEAEVVARAMVRAVAEAKPGLRLLPSAELQTLGAR